METSGFFDAVYNEVDESYDLQYLSSQFASYFALFIGNGVFGSPTNQLRVRAGSGMTVTVSTGWAFINGYWYYNDEELILPIPSNVSSQSRVDSVMCRWNSNDRRISVVLVSGSKEAVRNSTVYDLKLAEIVISPGSSQILDAFITDTRMNEQVCGLVTQLLEVQTTEDLFAQYQAIFEEWFTTVKGQVTGDLAIRLQQEFVELNKKTDVYQTSVETAIREYYDATERQIEMYKTSTDEDIESIQQTANVAYSIMSDFTDADFTLPLQELTFFNKQCIIIDSRLTKDSLVDVYFTADTMAIAETATIYVDSEDGRIVLTAKMQPTNVLKARIRVRVM